MKTLKNYIPAVLVAGAMVLLALVLFFKPFEVAHGNVTTNQPAITPDSFREYTFFASTTNQTIFATSTTATSTNITTWIDSNGITDKGFFVINGARRVTLTFKRGDTLGTGNTGSNLFRVQVTQKVSPVEADWYYFDKFTNGTSTTPTTFSNPTLTSTSTSIMGMDLLTANFYAIRIISVETTDGDVQVSAAANY